MWEVRPAPDHSNPADVTTAQFCDALAELDPSLDVVVHDGPGPAARVNVTCGGWDFALLAPPPPALLGVKAAPGRSQLIGLVRWFRALVPRSTPLILVEYESGFTVVSIRTDTTDEDMHPAVGWKEW